MTDLNPRWFLPLVTVGLLLASNLFMTFAWYGHLKHLQKPLWWAVLTSWGIAFFEYCLQVPANRIGAKVLSPAQLKIIQEAITILIFFRFYGMVSKKTSLFQRLDSLWINIFSSLDFPQ